MKKRFLVVLALALLLGLSAGVSFASQHGSRKAKGQQGKFKNKVGAKASMFLKNKEELELSEEQVKKIKALTLKVKKELIKQSAEIKILALDIKAEMWEDNVDLEAVNAFIDQKYELKKAKEKSALVGYVELESILTESQKGKLKELHKKRKMEKRKMHH